MIIEQDTKLDFKDVLIRPKRSTLGSRKNVILNRKFKSLHSDSEINCVPIVSANMSATGTFAMARTLAKHGLLTALHKHYLVDELANFFFTNVNLWNNVFYTIGMSESDIEKLENVKRKILELSPLNSGIDIPVFPKMICIDVANGYTKHFHTWVAKVRKLYPKSIIMAGNVATPDMVQQILERGADICKVGIGPGSSCTTRVKTAVGYPQLSCVIECADAAHGYGGMICSDGGCIDPGDICRAFGAGSDFAMLGGMLAGTDECEGEWIYSNTNSISTIDDDDNDADNESRIVGDFTSIYAHGYGVYEDIPGYGRYTDMSYATSQCKNNNIERKKEIFIFHGMSSKEAMNKYNGGVDPHRTSEGKCVQIPYKGNAEAVITDILGGLRSCCTYVGASRLKDLSKCCTFIRVNRTHNTVFGS